jgi:hypothetical protein
MEENKNKKQWPLSVSGSTSENQISRNASILDQVLECTHKMAIQFNDLYANKEALFAVATASPGYQFTGSQSNAGSVSFYVNSLETNKSMNIISIALIEGNNFKVTLSIFTDMGRVELGDASNCDELRELILEAINHDEVRKQLTALRSK